jgi:processing peptidase subunit alpha
MSAILRPRASLVKPTLALTKRLASTIPAPPPPQITTLSNKLRVVTESTPGHFHAVGVYVDAGSRYETKRNSGISHLMDRLAFKVGLSIPSHLICVTSGIIEE